MVTLWVKTIGAETKASITLEDTSSTLVKNHMIERVNMQDLQILILMINGFNIEFNKYWLCRWESYFRACFRE